MTALGRAHCAFTGLIATAIFVLRRRAASGCKANALLAELVGFGSNSLDKAVHDALFAGLVEVNGELVAVDLRHIAVAELLMEDAVA